MVTRVFWDPWALGARMQARMPDSRYHSTPPERGGAAQELTQAAHGSCAGIPLPMRPG